MLYVFYVSSLEIREIRHISLNTPYLFYWILVFNTTSMAVPFVVVLQSLKPETSKYSRTKTASHFILPLKNEEWESY